MIFMVHYEIKPENRNTSYNRTLALGGDGVPKEVEILGTWSSVTQLEGWVVVKSDDMLLIGKWLRHWTDLNVNRIIPLVDLEMQKEIMTSTL